MKHCDNLSLVLIKSLIEMIPAYNRVAVLIHIDKLLCRSWWQPVVSIVKTNAALLISNRSFDLFTKLRDSRWRSDRQVLSCRAWVVRSVVDEHIRHCAITGTKTKVNIWMLFSYEQHWSFSLGFLVFGRRRFRVTNASILATVVRNSSRKEFEYYLLSYVIMLAFLWAAELVFLGWIHELWKVHD